MSLPSLLAPSSSGAGTTEVWLVSISLLVSVQTHLCSGADASSLSLFSVSSPVLFSFSHVLLPSLFFLNTLSCSFFCSAASFSFLHHVHICDVSTLTPVMRRDECLSLPSSARAVRNMSSKCCGTKPTLTRGFSTAVREERGVDCY